MLDVLFLELEGVLADTRELRAAALVEALAAEGVSLLAEVAAEHAPGRTPRHAVEQALRAAGRELDAVGMDLAVLRAEKAFESRIGRGVTLLPGALPFLNRAHAAAGGRARLALVTRVPRNVAGLVLGLAGVEFLFDAIVAGSDVRHDADPGEAHRLALGRLAARRPLGPGRRVALVDGAEGAAEARAAGVLSVVTGAVPPHEALEADAMVPGLDGLTLDMLDALLARADQGTP
jgi:beta-phosphoglucomutase-like phosphatase (HAD superfamily)